MMFILSQSVNKWNKHEMAAVKLFLALLSLRILTCNGYILTELADFRDFDPRCIAEYVNKNYHFNVKIRWGGQIEKCAIVFLIIEYIRIVWISFLLASEIEAESIEYDIKAKRAVANHLWWFFYCKLQVWLFVNSTIWFIEINPRVPFFDKI